MPHNPEYNEDRHESGVFPAEWFHSTHPTSQHRERITMTEYVRSRDPEGPFPIRSAEVNPWGRRLCEYGRRNVFDSTDDEKESTTDRNVGARRD